MTYQHLSVEEREEIQQGLWRKESIRSIAERLGRSPASVSREICRNGSPLIAWYTPRLAEARSNLKRKSRGRKDRLKTETIRRYVVEKMKIVWSPEQIAGRMKIEGVGSISHEAIYQFVYAQIHRGGNGWVKPGKEDLRPYLKRRHKKRAKKGMRKGERIFRPKGPSIEDRPLVVDLRTRIGDWESDSVASKNYEDKVPCKVPVTDECRGVAKARAVSVLLFLGADVKLASTETPTGELGASPAENRGVLIYWKKK